MTWWQIGALFYSLAAAHFIGNAIDSVDGAEVFRTMPRPMAYTVAVLAGIMMPVIAAAVIVIVGVMKLLRVKGV